MVDYKVTFKGDLGNLAQFDAAIRNSVTASSRAIEQANKGLLSQVGNIQGLFTPGKSGAGLFYSNLKTQIDGVNRTFIHSGDVIRNVIKDYELIANKARTEFKLNPIYEQQYQSPYKAIIGDLDKREEALKRIEPTEQKILADRENTLKRTIPLQQRITELYGLQAKAQERIGSQGVTNEASTAAVRGKLRQAQEQLPLIDPKNKQAIKQAQLQIAALSKELEGLEARGAAALDPLNKDLVGIDKEINQLIAKIRLLEIGQQGRATIFRNRNPAYADLTAADNATPPIQRDLATVLSRSESLRKELLKAGLGQGTAYGSKEFQKALADQEAAVTHYTRNLRTNVSNVQGVFKDASGLANTFTVDLDDQGKVIGRWGGQLAGAGTFLRQTVRDFQKVIEWTVATTVVFGSLAAVVKQLGSINELNQSLTRLSITAQTTSQETQGLFQQISDVAISTATPLNDLVTAADDIALAVRKAGDSSDEFHAKIIDLTRAVGIFTNLTGTDTVQATDQLSAAFKQLNVEPAQLVGILSKVTAVAGGQSTAINDIVKGLSSLAEAAKAAGLSVDEQIASIQVLSQVTNKSSDEVATSFKNLFGAVSSVGSEKILKSFGIEIRDAQGGLKDFLDIYSEIKNALDTGIIPQNRLPDILRGIAGGPRRAPDAAALLANLDKIFQVVGKSANATNEALVANAKILDTNTAKITQFQNAVNIAVFEKFGKAVQDLVGFLTGLGTAAATGFNLLDQNLVNLALKLGLVVIAVKTFGAGLRLLGAGGILTSIINGLKGVTTSVAAVGEAAEVSAAQLTLFKEAEISSATTPASRGGGALSKLSGNKKLLAGLGIFGVGAVAGLTQKQSGLDTNTIGSALQLGGSLALLIPSLQGIGVAAIAAGTAMQLLAGDTEQVKESARDTAQDIYTLTQSLKDTQSSANEFVKQQSEAKATIDELAVKTKKTKEEQDKLTAATDSYVTATLGLADANKEVSKTLDEILTKLPGLQKQLTSFRNLSIDALRRGDAGTLQELQTQLSSAILQGTGQDTVSATIPVEIKPEFTIGKDYGTTVIDLIQGAIGGGRAGAAPLTAPFDLNNLLTNYKDVTKLFDVNTGTPRFNPSQIDSRGYEIIQQALAKLSEDVTKGAFPEDQFRRLVDAAQSLAESASSFASNTASLAQTQAGIQSKVALGIFTQQQGQNASAAATLAQTLNQASGQYRPSREAGPDTTPDLTALQNAQKLIAEFNKAAQEGTTLTVNQLIEAGKAVLVLGGNFDTLKNISDEALNKGIYQALKSAGVSAEDLDNIAKVLKIDLQDAANAVDDLSESFDNARKSAASAFANRALQLQIAKNSGDFKNNAKGLKELTDQNKQALDSNNALIDSISQLASSAMVDLNQELSKIIGLQGEYLTQTEINTNDTKLFTDRVIETTGKLLENAVAAGVNADGIKKIQVEIAKLIAIITAIPTYKQVVIDVQQRLSYTGYSPGGFNAIQQELDTAKANDEANTKAQKAALKEITNAINKIISSGRGSTFGKTSSSRTRSSGSSGPDVSELDLPDEIANATNRSALIQEAIRRARALQSTIPGETKEAKNDIVALLKGTQNILNVRGVKDDYLRRALEELADVEKKRLEFETKADTIRRIRVGAGDFSAIANVPVNTRTGVSLGGQTGPINVTLNINGTVLTPAQLGQFADLVAAALKRQIANG